MILFIFSNPMKSKVSQVGPLKLLLPPVFSSLVQPVISSVIKYINGRGFRRAEK